MTTFTNFPIIGLPATAARITNVPSGTVSATNVQDAINELALEGVVGPQGPPGNSGAVVDWVSVIDHGAVGDGVADDTVAIQDAIDFACDNEISTIYIPSGTYKITDTIYLDPPDNLRLAPVDTTKRIDFTLALIGDEDCGGGEFGTVIRPVSNSVPALVVGPGQGMVVKGLVIGPTTLLNYRANCPALIPCIGFVGGSGASRFRCENVYVAVFYTGFLTGYLGDGLGDSGTFIKCRTFGCAIGAWVQHTQNFINSFIDCNFEATTAILCSNGGGAQIFGGNYSCVNSAKAVLTAGSISALTATAFGNAFSYTFTAAVTADSNFTGPDGVYNAFVFNTGRFGPVPCTLNSFTAGTATFQILQTWVETHFGQSFNIKTATDIEAEIQACIKVYCAERCIAFRGSNISVNGVHIENNATVCCLIHAEITFGDNRPNRLTNVFYNTDSSNFLGAPAFTPTDTNFGLYLISKVFPFIEQEMGDIYIGDSQLGCVEYIPVKISNAYQLVVERCTSFRPNLYTSGGGAGISVIDLCPCIRADRYHFYPTTSGSPSFEIDARAVTGTQITEYWAYRPAPYTTPAIPMADFTTLSGALPAISSTSVPYPMIWGGQVYRKYDFYTGSTATYQFASDHHYYSYGQDLTTSNVSGLSWSYKGQSPVVSMDNSSMDLMRPGLGIKLNNGGGDILYIVTGVHPLSNYVTVSQSPHFTAPGAGSSTSSFSGTTIGQEVFSISSF